MDADKTTALAEYNMMPITNFTEAVSLGKAFAKAKVMGARSDSDGLLVVALVREMGLVKAEATRHLMNGRITKKAGAILADFVRLGGTYKIIRRDAECAEILASMGDNKDLTFSFSWEDAQKEPFVYRGGPKDQMAELDKPFADRRLKDKYKTPRSRMQMLWARLSSDLGTALCPGACEGLYPPEVVSDFPENEAPEGKGGIIDGEEVAARMDRINGVDEPAPADFTVCPFGGEGVKGAKWAQFSTAVLEKAVASDKPEMTSTHKAAARLVLDERKQEAK